MEIRLAETQDLETLLRYDKHIGKDEMNDLIKQGRVLIAEDSQGFCGWLRYNLFWDNTPFMNMLYLLEEARGKGYGKKLVKYWEDQMKKAAFQTVLTSTASDEYAQHFYVKLNYKVIGGFLLEGEPYEVILAKNL